MNYEIRWTIILETQALTKKTKMTRNLGRKLILDLPFVGVPANPNVPNPTRRIRQLLEVDDDLIALALFLGIQNQLIDM